MPLDRPDSADHKTVITRSLIILDDRKNFGDAPRNGSKASTTCNAAAVQG
jgi:hypothetical protein